MAALGTEAASWYFTKRAMQGAADSGAATAAAALAAGAPSSTLATEAKSIAAGYNFVDGSNGTTVTVNYPPQSGPNQGRLTHVEVMISQPQSRLLSALFISTGPIISVRAVAKTDLTHAGKGCVVALDPNDETSMTTSGSSTNLAFPSCSLYVNSPSQIGLIGGGTISAKAAYFVGGFNGPTLTPPPPNGVYTGVNPMIDPYLTVAVPSYSGCDSTNYNLTSGSSVTLNAGASGMYVFCSGVKLVGNSSLTLGPGTFILDQGLLTIEGGSTLRATSGTTIILTTSNPARGCATTKIAGGAVLSITAPTSGALKGVALYLDRACTDPKVTNDLAGGGTQNIVGAIYFPGEKVNYAGGSATGEAAACTQLIAWKIDFTGGSNFNSDCDEAGTRLISLTGSQLVE